MTEITPFVQEMAVFTTFAPSIITVPPSTFTVAALP